MKKTIKTEKQLISFINTSGIAKRLKFLARTLLLVPKKFRFIFKYNTGSYTNGTEIHVGIPEYLINHTKEETFFVLKALTAHEVEHINSSSFDGLREFKENFSEYFFTTHGIDKRLGGRVGGYLDNAIEDGRIENILTKRTPGMKKPISYFRSLWWINNEIKEEKEGDNVLFDTLFAICTIATMGQYPRNFLDKHQENYPELLPMLKVCKKHIYRCVDCDNVEDYYNNLWQLVYILEAWLIQELKKLPNDIDAEEKIAEMSKEFGEKDSESHSTPSGKVGKKPLKPSDKDSDKDDGKDSDKDESKPVDEDEDENKGMGNLEDKEDHEIFNGNMDDIVKEAIKSAESEIMDSEKEIIIQAELDDLKQKETEEANNKESDIEDKTLKPIISDYEKKAWRTNFVIHRNKYPLLRADSSVLLDSKKSKTQFAEIFLNKNTSPSKNRKRGLLNVNDLYKTAYGENKIFMKKGVVDDSNFVFYLLVDGSGSMGHNKFIEAYKATACLEECLSNLAPLKIVQFDCGGNRVSIVNHYIVKDYNDNGKGNYSTTFAKNSSSRNANMDGFSIRVATAELLKRSEAEKVLIILSDGLPSGSVGYYGKEAQTDVKNAIRDSRKKGIKVFNIMFGSELERKELTPDFKYMYEKGIVSCSPENISSTLVKIVKKELSK